MCYIRMLYKDNDRDRARLPADMLARLGAAPTLGAAASLGAEDAGEGLVVDAFALGTRAGGAEATGASVRRAETSSWMSSHSRFARSCLDGRRSIPLPNVPRSTSCWSRESLHKSCSRLNANGEPAFLCTSPTSRSTSPCNQAVSLSPDGSGRGFAGVGTAMAGGLGFLLPGTASGAFAALRFPAGTPNAASTAFQAVSSSTSLSPSVPSAFFAVAPTAVILDFASVSAKAALNSAHAAASSGSSQSAIVTDAVT